MFKKYPKIYYLGQEETRDILHYEVDSLVIEEKVDGGNGSMWLEDGVVHFGSRNRDLTAEKDDKTFALYRKSLEKLIEDKSLNEDYIYYFEWMALHTIQYDKTPPVIGVDIRLKRSSGNDGCGLFIGRESRVQEFDRLGIENVPLVWSGTVNELKDKKIEDIIPKSKYYSGSAEGIVIKNYCRKATEGNHQLYAKLVRDEFKECNRAVFGGIRQKESDAKKIAEKFFTPARVRKIVNKHINEKGMELNLKLMEHVPTAVIKDVLAEEFNDIYDDYNFIDFKEMRKIVVKDCLNTIRDMMKFKAGDG